jgi:hypothetical protein
MFMFSFQSVVSSAQVSASSIPGLGNLQSVVGSGMGNAITTTSVVTISSHSPLTTALQGGNSNIQSSTNIIGTQVKSSSTTASVSTTTAPHEIQSQASRFHCVAAPRSRVIETESVTALSATELVGGGIV